MTSSNLIYSSFAWRHNYWNSRHRELFWWFPGMESHPPRWNLEVSPKFWMVPGMSKFEKVHSFSARFCAISGWFRGNCIFIFRNTNHLLGGGSHISPWRVAWKCLSYEFRDSEALRASKHYILISSDYPDLRFENPDIIRIMGFENPDIIRIPDFKIRIEDLRIRIFRIYVWGSATQKALWANILD